MPTDDPEILPAPSPPDETAPELSAEVVPPAPSRPTRIPHIGHTVLFFVVAAVVMIVVSVSAFAIIMGLHLMGNETADQLLREPRLLIPSMAGAYLIIGAIVWAVFARLWRQPFPQALHWDFALVRRRWPALLGGGIALSLGVQFLSNFLPIPKTLPVDDFFRTPGDVWMVSLFGTLIAPLFEELAFRGFLLPSLASAWDWLRTPKEQLLADELSAGPYLAPAPEPGKDPRWSFAAITVSCALSSVAFTLLHADQLAHAWAPLVVLFGVSLVLCAVRLWTHSLAASTFVHATYNGTIFSILFIVTRGFRHLDKIT